MNWKKTSIKAGAAAALSIALLVVGVQPASANSITTYCNSNLYSNSGHTSNSQPNQIGWCQIQAGPASDPSNASWAGGFVYPYIIDGVPGPNTWKGLQTYLRNWGYTGPINGVPGTNTYNAMIRAGNYIAPYGVQAQDGSLGTTDWKNFIYEVKISYFGL
jgi:peptidoglycan hydrolase-like protein with peptidoglycan-binding domain